MTAFADMVQTNSIAGIQPEDARKAVAIRTKSGSISGSIFLKRVETAAERQMMDDIIVKYHSYIKNTATVGRQINYLVYYNGNVVGCIGGQSPPMPMSKCVQDYFQKVAAKTMNLTEDEARKAAMNLKDWALPHMANNWKFALTPDAPHNAGSKILSIFVKLLAKDWKQKYGDELKWVLTYVGAGKDGTVYKAAGWEYIGTSRGHHFKGGLYKSSVANKNNPDFRREEWVDTQPKKIFIKAIGD